MWILWKVKIKIWIFGWIEDFCPSVLGYLQQIWSSGASGTFGSSARGQATSFCRRSHRWIQFGANFLASILQTQHLSFWGTFHVQAGMATAYLTKSPNSFPMILGLKRFGFDATKTDEKLVNLSVCQVRIIFKSGFENFPIKCPKIKKRPIFLMRVSLLLP